jgi:hypothetical protein
MDNPIVRVVGTAAIVSAIVLLYARWLQVNPTTVGFSLLLAVLLISAAWGLRCVTAELRDSEIITSIADHGPGIDDIEEEMIFEKFYRGRDQRMIVQGTGMGLAIVKAIIELHSGTIGVTSQLGRGSVFFFSLPANA